MSLVAALLFWCSALGLGVALTRAARLQTDWVELTLFSGLLGAGALGLIGLVLGLIGPYTRTSLLILLLAGCSGWVALRGARVEPTNGIVPSSRWVQAIALLSLVGLAVSAFAAFAPPTNADELYYHLAIPQAYLRHGKVLYLPGILKASLPHLESMIFGFGLALSGATTPHLLSYGFGILLLVGTFTVARRAGLTAAWVAVALVVAISDVSYQMSMADIDIAIAAFQVLAFHCFLRFLEGGERKYVILSGLLLGLAASCKISAGILGVALLGAWVWREGRTQPQRLRALAIPAILYCGAILLPLVPWLLKTWWLTGNPFFPLFFDWFGGPDLTPEMAHQFVQVRMGQSFVQERSVVGLLTLPWDATMAKIRATGYVGPALLAFCPALWIWRKALPDFARLGALTALLCWPLWYLTSPASRFFLGPLALLACAAGALCTLDWPVRAATIAGKALVAVTALSGLAINAYYHRDAVLCVAGRLTPEQYLARRFRGTDDFPYFGVYRWASTHSSISARFIIPDERVLPLDRDAVPSEQAVGGMLRRDEIESEAGVLRGFHRLGVSYVVAGPNVHAPLGDRLSALERDGYLRLLYSDGDRHLLAVPGEMP